MIFFLDENFPKSVVSLLEQKGHKIIDIRSTEHEGSNDIKIFELAQKEKAIFLTTDRDFFHTIPRLYQNHYGIIVITLRKPNRKEIAKKLLVALNIFDLQKFESKVLLLKDNSYSIYGNEL